MSRPRTPAEWLSRILPLLVALLIPAATFAQTGSITGTVTSSVTGVPIANVPIFIVRSDNLSDSGVVFSGLTNASGVYTFTGAAGGYYIAAVPSEEGAVDFGDEIYGGIRAPIDFPDLVDGRLVTIIPGNTAAANFALLPAGHVTGTITDAAARLSGRPRHRAARAAQDAGGRAPELRQVLVAAQVAVALVLLATTGLFLRALQQAAGAPTGYDGDRILVMSIDTNHAGRPGAQASALADRLIQRSAG